MPTLKGWLKTAVIDANKPKNSIIDVLRHHLSGYEVGRDRSIVHASDITKPSFCPRHWAFLDIKGVDNSQGYFIKTALRVTYNMGNITAKALIEDWAGDAAYGNWVCRRCHSQTTMTSKPKGGCGKSNDCIWEYCEVSVSSPAHDVSGSMDVLFNVGTPKLLITELKILAPDDFDKMVAPLPEHRIRTALYLKLWAESNSPYKDRINLHEGRVLYVSRAYGKANPAYAGEVLPFREFEIFRDDEGLIPILQKPAQLKIYREKGLMPSGICSTAVDKMAKNCTSCTACFSGHYPSQQEALF